ncbi:MAG: hypothetical protein ACPGO3_12960 [Magnetospiraceae bacterium]
MQLGRQLIRFQIAIQRVDAQLIEQFGLALGQLSPQSERGGALRRRPGKGEGEIAPRGLPIATAAKSRAESLKDIRALCRASFEGSVPVELNQGCRLFGIGKDDLALIGGRGSVDGVEIGPTARRDRGEKDNQTPFSGFGRDVR